MIRFSSKVLIISLIVFGCFIIKGLFNRKYSNKLFVLPTVSVEEKELNEDQFKELNEDQFILKSIWSTVKTELILKLLKEYYLEYNNLKNYRKIFKKSVLLLSNDLDFETKCHIQYCVISVGTYNERFDFGNLSDYNHRSLVETIDRLIKIAYKLSSKSKGVSFSKKNNIPYLVINSFLRSIDPYSFLLEEESYQSLLEGTSGIFGGVGILVGLKNQILTVLKIFANSPAEKSGLKKYDQILSINGISTYEHDIDYLVNLMKGEPGSEVQFSILHKGAFASELKTIKRDWVKVDSVKSKILKRGKNKILVLRLDSFNNNTSLEIKTILSKLYQSNNNRLDGIILDLRNNPGGILEEAVNVADIFLESGVIVTITGKYKESLLAHKDFFDLRQPLLILINENSASASEIVAGALQDAGRAVILGRKSYGKGTVQTLIDLPFAGAFKVTIAEYLKPSGERVEGKGIIPDIAMTPLQKIIKNNFSGSVSKNEVLFVRRKISKNFLSSHFCIFKMTSLCGNSISRSNNHVYFFSDYNFESFQDSINTKLDTELRLAQFILFKFLKNTKMNPQYSKSISSKFLFSKVRNDLKLYLKKMNSELISSLKKEYINWDDVHYEQAFVQKNLRLSVASFVNPEIKSGSNISLPIKIHNYSQQNFRKISVGVFIQQGLEKLYFEFPMDEIKKNKSLLKKIEIPIPNEWTFGKFNLSKVLLFNGKFLSDQDLNILSFKIVPRGNGSISLSYNFNKKDENLKRRNLKIRLINVGQINISNLRVKLINLSGTRLEINNDSFFIKNISKNKKKEILTTVNIRSRAKSEMIQLGVFLDSIDLDEPVKKIITVPPVISYEGELKRY